MSRLIPINRDELNFAAPPAPPPMYYPYPAQPMQPMYPGYGYPVQQHRGMSTGGKIALGLGGLALAATGAAAVSGKGNITQGFQNIGNAISGKGPGKTFTDRMKYAFTDKNRAIQTGKNAGNGWQLSFKSKQRASAENEVARMGKSRNVDKDGNLTEQGKKAAAYLAKGYKNDGSGNYVNKTVEGYKKAKADYDAKKGQTNTGTQSSGQSGTNGAQGTQSQVNTPQNASGVQPTQGQSQVTQQTQPAKPADPLASSIQASNEAEAQSSDKPVQLNRGQQILGGKKYNVRKLSNEDLQAVVKSGESGPKIEEAKAEITRRATGNTQTAQDNLNKSVKKIKPAMLQNADSRDLAQAMSDIKNNWISWKGLGSDHQLTPEETKELRGYALDAIRKRVGNKATDEVITAAIDKHMSMRLMDARDYLMFSMACQRRNMMRGKV